MKREVNGFLFPGAHTGKLLHRCAAAIGTEDRLLAHPLGAFFRDGPLGEFVTQSHLELAAVKAAFAFQFWDVELAVFLLQFIRGLAGNERGRGENELERFDLLQLRFERLERVNGEARRRDLEFRSGRNRLLQAVAEQLIDVVDDFHASGRRVADARQQQRSFAPTAHSQKRILGVNHTRAFHAPR